MRKNTILSILCLMPVFLQAQLKPILADSKISGVTVFQNTAEITREAKIQLNPGTNMIAFEKLSQSIVSGSIRVEGSDQFTIVSVNSSVDYLKEGSERPEVKAMKKELNRVQDEIKLNQSYLNVYQEQQNLLLANHVFKGENKGITVEDMLNMTEIYKSKLWEIQQKIYDCEIKAKRMNSEYAKISRQVSELETKFNRYTSTVNVNLSASVRVNATVKITYLVNNAYWTANYDAKAKDLNSPLELVLKATVVQTTGEDWQNVKLKLSTGNPVKNKNKPELTAWNLYAYDEVVYKNNRKQKGKETMKTEAYGGDISGNNDVVPGVINTNEEVVLQNVVVVDAKKQANSVPVSFTSTSSYNYTQIIETGVNAEYAVDVPYTILSDGKEITVEVKKYEIPASYSYYAVPKLDKDAFLVASVTGWEKYNLIPGYVNVYINDTYTGRSWFDSQSVEDTLDLSMGRDQSIIVSRKKVKDFSGNAVIGGSRKSNMGFEISVRNTRKTPVTLFLYDQFPLSQYKEIEITNGETSGAKHNKETGKLEWEMELPAGGDKKVNFNYSVKYPKDKTISNIGG